MAFSVKATYKEETRTIAVAAGPDSFPAYADVQDKLREAFSLPSSTKTHWWHVYFAPDEGIPDVKFRRHVCSDEEYQVAKGDLVAFTWPRPTLAFQVLIAGDPRLSTADKYHASLGHVARREQLLADFGQAEASLHHVDGLVRELMRKRESCKPEDALIRGFWDARVLEQTRLRGECESRLSAIDASIRALEAGKQINKAVLDKENGRNAAAKKDIETFCCVWGIAPRTDAIRAKYTALRAKANPPIIVRSLPVPPVQAASGAPAPSNRWSGSSGKATSGSATASPLPTSPFPNLDAVLDRHDGTSSALKGLTDKVKEITGAQALVISQEIKQQSAGISHDLRSALDGFLNNLTNQLNTFEDSIKEKHRPVFRETGVSVDSSEDGDDQDQFPGAFVKSPQDTKPKVAASSASAKTHAHSLYLSSIVCDVCDQTPKAVRWHCDVCRDYDVCADCLHTLKAGAHDESHTFTAVYHSSLTNVIGKKPAEKKEATEAKAPAGTSLARHNAYCDGCEQRIYGDRYKCLACPDYDVCADCWDKVGEKHAPHNFVKLAAAGDLKLLAPYVPKTIHRNVICDACDRAILGVRYKCVHPECKDFDLCEHCEPLKKHPEDHPLLKMKQSKRIDNFSYFSAPSGLFSQGVTPKASEPQASSSASPEAPRPAKTSALASRHRQPVEYTLPPLFNHPPPVTHTPVTAQGRPERQAFNAYLQRGAAVDHLINAGRRSTGDNQMDSTQDLSSRSAPRRLPEPRPAPDAEALQRILARQAELDALLNGRPRAAPAVIPSSDAPTPLEAPAPTPAEHSAPAVEVDASAGDKWIDQLFAQRGKMIETLQAQTAEAATPALVAPVESEPAQVANSGTATPLIQLDQSVTATAVSTPASAELESAPKVELDATFMHDVTAPDGLEMAPYTAFEKVWKMKNTGAAAIPAGVQCVFMGGSGFGLAPSTKHTVTDKAIEVGAEFEVRIDGLATPERQGEHMGFWRLMDGDGNWFGDKLWCEVEVVDTSASGTLTHSSIIMPRMPNAGQAVASEPAAVPQPAVEDPATPMITAQSSVNGDATVSSPAHSLVSLDDWSEDDFIVVDDSTDDDA